MSLSLCLIKPVFKHHIALSLVGAAAALGYAAYLHFQSRNISSSTCKSGQPHINPNFKKDEPKIVDSFDFEDLPDKTVLCRCWRSKCFPKCDGSHTKYNKETGDNVGPVIIKRREPRGTP